jgi:hypothetical protein
MPQLRRLVDSLPLQELSFRTRLLLAEFMIDKIILDYVFSEYFSLSCRF